MAVSWIGRASTPTTSCLVSPSLGGLSSLRHNQLGEATKAALRNGATRTSSYDALGSVIGTVLAAAGGVLDSDLKYACDAASDRP